MEEADSLWSRNVLLTPGPPLTAYANGLWANRVGCDLRPEIDALETGRIGSTLAHRFHQIRARVYPRGQSSPDQPTPACSRISHVLYTMSPLIVAGVLAWVLTKGFSPP